jgi:hypothetical protein
MNKHLKALMTGTFAVASAALTFIACQKGDVQHNETTALKVYLTDHPADYDQVLVNITTVEAKIDTGKATCKDDRHGSRPEAFDHHGDDHRSRKDAFGFWQTLSFKPGSYDLLTLRNGVDTLLATGTVTGTIRKIRMGVSSVTVVKKGVSYPVILAPEMQNYIYVHLHSKELDKSADSSKVWVDFDVSRSIVEQNGQFYLRPVLKPFNDRNFGGLEGSVTPSEAGVVVTAYGSTDTASAIPDKRGQYCIRGLDGGSYKLVFDAKNGYIDTTINNVSVTAGRKTRVAAVVLKK